MPMPLAFGVNPVIQLIEISEEINSAHLGFESSVKSMDDPVNESKIQEGLSDSGVTS